MKMEKIYNFAKEGFMVKANFGHVKSARRDSHYLYYYIDPLRKNFLSNMVAHFLLATESWKQQ